MQKCTKRKNIDQRSARIIDFLPASTREPKFPSPIDTWLHLNTNCLHEFELDKKYRKYRSLRNIDYSLSIPQHQHPSISSILSICSWRKYLTSNVRITLIWFYRKTYITSVLQVPHYFVFDNFNANLFQYQFLTNKFCYTKISTKT